MTNRELLTRVLFLAAAFGALAHALLTLEELSKLGFPDGHLTDYESAIAGPLKITAILEAICAAIMMVLNLAPYRPAPSGGITVVLAGIVCLAMVTGTLVLPWYFGTYLRLEAGRGG